MALYISWAAIFAPDMRLVCWAWRFPGPRAYTLRAGPIPRNVWTLPFWILYKIAFLDVAVLDLIRWDLSVRHWGVAAFDLKPLFFAALFLSAASFKRPWEKLRPCGGKPRGCSGPPCKAEGAWALVLALFWWGVFCFPEVWVIPSICTSG